MPKRPTKEIVEQWANSPLDDEALAKSLGISLATVKRYFRKFKFARLRRPRQIMTVEAITKLLKAGNTRRQTAEILGVKFISIGSYMAQHGLHSKVSDAIYSDETLKALAYHRLGHEDLMIILGIKNIQSVHALFKRRGIKHPTAKVTRPTCPECGSQSIIRRGWGGICDNCGGVNPWNSCIVTKVEWV